MPDEIPATADQKAHVLGVIPARWGSTRFPGKPLHEICGKPLVQHVWERCKEAQQLDAVVIATDDERIADAALGFGAEVAMTSPDHPSGTDRIAEVAAARPEATHIINVQGDEPLIAPDLIDQLAGELVRNSKISMITAANPLKVLKDREDSNIVKVVLDCHDHALYFSRSAIPFHRDATPENPETHPTYQHKGIYGYTRELLLEFVRWEPTPLEQVEKLEQLRVLENGYRIKVVLTDEESIGVDTQEQAVAVAHLISATNNQP